MLHIDKDDDLMSILSERIPSSTRSSSVKNSGASEFKRLRDDIVDIPQTVADNATSGATLTLQAGYDVVPDGEQTDKIRDYIAEKLNRLVERASMLRRFNSSEKTNTDSVMN